MLHFMLDLHKIPKRLESRIADALKRSSSIALENRIARNYNPHPQ